MYRIEKETVVVCLVLTETSFWTVVTCCYAIRSRLYHVLPFSDADCLESTPAFYWYRTGMKSKIFYTCWNRGAENENRIQTYCFFFLPMNLLANIYSHRYFFLFESIIYFQINFWHMWTKCLFGSGWRRPCGRRRHMCCRRCGRQWLDAEMLVLFETAAGFAVFKVRFTSPSYQKNCSGVLKSRVLILLFKISCHVLAVMLLVHVNIFIWQYWLFPLSLKLSLINGAIQR